MENVVTANELKTKGISRLDEITSNGDEAIISVRGKRRYVVLTVEQYNYLRECELEAALIETRKDLDHGDVVQESVEAHIQRITRPGDEPVASIAAPPQAGRKARWSVQRLNQYDLQNRD